MALRQSGRRGGGEGGRKGRQEKLALDHAQGLYESWVAVCSRVVGVCWWVEEGQVLFAPGRAQGFVMAGWRSVSR